MEDHPREDRHRPARAQASPNHHPSTRGPRAARVLIHVQGEPHPHHPSAPGLVKAGATAPMQNRTHGDPPGNRVGETQGGAHARREARRRERSRTVIIWQYDASPDRDPRENAKAKALLRLHGFDLLRVPATTTLKIDRNHDGEVTLNAWRYDEGYPLCGNCECCVSGRLVSVPLVTRIPDIGWTKRGVDQDAYRAVPAA
jgi:hypothetical protein